MYSRRLLIATKTHLRAELGGLQTFAASFTKVRSEDLPAGNEGRTISEQC